LRLGDVWVYRELLYFLVWRDVKVRYKQTAFGVLWVVLQPFITMVIFTVFFGNWANIPSDGVPYPIFVYAALLPWQLFAGSLASSGYSLVTNQHLLTKVYFPRLIIPLSAVFSGLVDFSVSFLILLVLMAYYGIMPAAAVVLLPLFVLLALIAALAAGLWLAALNVQYRDVQYAIPFLIQVWLFLTPIAYPISIVPEQWRALYALNPMVGVVEGFRWALLGQGRPLDVSISLSVLITLILLVGGLFYFQRMERTFADVV
jgi:lipopolysaccharide transport system permease protein